MNEQRERIKRFISDKGTNEAVYDSVRDSFLRSFPNEDVNLKAARFIALELLASAWRSMGQMKELDTDTFSTENVGL